MSAAYCQPKAYALCQYDFDVLALQRDQSVLARDVCHFNDLLNKVGGLSTPTKIVFMMTLDHIAINPSETASAVPVLSRLKQWRLRLRR